MIEKILITGSSGIIGTRLSEKLLEKDYKIVGVDKKENKWNKRIDEITLKGNLKNKRVFEDIPKDIDLIVHLAANARVYDLIKNPNLSFENIETLFNILEFARKSNIEKIIFSSSREVYGENIFIDKLQSEKDSSIKSGNLYAASKLSGESLIHSYNINYNINFGILRFGNVYGMYDEYDRVIPSFINKCKNGEDLTIFGKEKKLDFIYIDDLVKGVTLSIDKFEEIKNETINLGSGVGTSVLEIAELIKKSINKENKILIKENRTGEVSNSILDISKAKKFLDFYPKVKIEDGIKKTIEWYKINT